MNIANLIAATAAVLLCIATGATAGSDGPDAHSRVVVSGYASSEKPMMARGTDLRPCKPGTHSEFSRLTGGYRCAHNP